MATNAYMRDITTSTSEASVDLSAIEVLYVANLNTTDTIEIAFGASGETDYLTSATEVITLQAKESSREAIPVKLPDNIIGDTLYYKASANTPVLRIIGKRIT